MQVDDFSGDQQTDREKQDVEDLHTLQDSLFDVGFPLFHLALFVDYFGRSQQLLEGNATLFDSTDDFALTGGDHAL